MWVGCFIVFLLFVDGPRFIEVLIKVMKYLEVTHSS